METLESILKRDQARLQEMETDLAAMDIQMQELRHKISVLQDDVSKRIRAGATTGDKIRDLVLAYSLGKERETQLRNVEAALAGNVGKLVLLACWGETCTRHVMVPTPGHENVYEDYEYFLIGVLTGERAATFLSTRM